MTGKAVESPTRIDDEIGGEPCGKVDGFTDRFRVSGVEVTGEAVDLRLGEAERLPDVLEDGLRPIGDHVRNHRRPLPPVAAVAVLDDLLAPLRLEVDVDIGRPGSLFREETFEGQVQPDGIDPGEAEATTYR